MERVLEAKQKAHEYYKSAEQTAHLAFQVVKNPKLMFPVVENAFLCMTNAMSAILYHQKAQGTIPAFNEKFDGKCAAFQKNANHKEYVKAMTDMRDLIIMHQKAPVEFQRGSSMVICQDDYQMKIVSPELARGYVAKAKKMTEYMEAIVNERVYL